MWPPLFRFSVTAELLERMENCPAIESCSTAVEPPARRPASLSAVQPPACQSPAFGACQSLPARRPASLSLRQPPDNLSLRQPPNSLSLCQPSTSPSPAAKPSPPQPPKRDLPPVGGEASARQQLTVPDYFEGRPPPRPPPPDSGLEIAVDGPAVSPSTTPDLLRFPRCDQVRTFFEVVFNRRRLQAIKKSTILQGEKYSTQFALVLGVLLPSESKQFCLLWFDDITHNFVCLSCR